MTIAAEVAARCSGSSAFTLAYGYAVHADGRRALFPPAHIAKERRNEKGRCTFARAEYHDGSALEFRWHPVHGSRLEIPA